MFTPKYPVLVRSMRFACVLAVLIGLSFTAWRVGASVYSQRLSAGQTTPAAHDRNGLAAALNPDGSLRAGANGSFNTSGFRMEYSATGAPRFVAAASGDFWDTQFNMPNGVPLNMNNGGVSQSCKVLALAVSGTNIYVGGVFFSANNIAATNVAKFDTLTNTWSKLGTGSGNGVTGGTFPGVYALAVIGSDLYVGGVFDTANVGGTTVSANNVAKFDTLTNTWSKLGAGSGNGVSNSVLALAVSGSDLYVGGAFTQANSGIDITANRVAKFNTTNGAWSALGTGSGNGLDGAVRGLVVSGTDLYVGGDFTTANVGGTTVSANRIAKFNTTTPGWSKLGTDGAGLSASVFVLALSGSGDLYACGDFTTANVGGTTVSANRVAKVNLTTGVWSALGTGSGNGVSGRASAMMLLGSDLYVGGNFTTANVGGTTVTANGIAKFDTLTNTWSKLGTGSGNGIDIVGAGANALAVIGSNIYVGSGGRVANFNGAPPVNASRIAKFDTTTNTWSGLGTGVGNGVNNVVNAVAVSGTNIFVGGDFTYAGNVAANRVAKFDTTTNTWSAFGTGGGNGVGAVNGLSTQVRALAVIGNYLYVGGDFQAVNAGGPTVSANYIAKVDITTGTWSALGTNGGNGVSGFAGGSAVRALAVSGSDLYVGGNFHTANFGGASGSTSAKNVAKFNTTTGVWSDLRGGVDGLGSAVYALAVSGSDLYVGGDFNTAAIFNGAFAASYIAKFNTTTPGWSKLGTGAGNGVNNIVRALAVSGSGDLYVGGDFTTANSDTVPANRVAKFNSTTGWSKLGTGAGNGVNAYVASMALRGSELFVGGESISQANVGGTTVSTKSLANFNTTTGVWRAVADSGGGNGANNIVSALAVGGSYLYAVGGFDVVGDNKPSAGIGRFFSANTSPTITAGATVTRQQGTTGSSATIATVSDIESSAGSIGVTATTVPTGISITDITNLSGTVTATVAADCTAATGNNTVVLTATDGTLTATANFIVTVTANTAPTVGTYANTSVAAGDSVTVTPNAAPADNGTIASVTATAAPNTFTGSFNGNISTGALTITNAGPSGTYTITVTVTDNCGATAQRTFTLTINNPNSPPTITAGATVTRQQGSAGSTATIATVSDAESGAGGVTVTATTVPTGISITGITNSSGTVMATVAAGCNAAPGDNTIVLTASDGTVTTTANFIVTVTTNTAPTVGTYANTTLNPNGGTTVTPNAAPADNGSIANVTATASPNTFTGSFTQPFNRRSHDHERRAIGQLYDHRDGDGQLRRDRAADLHADGQ